MADELATHRHVQEVKKWTPVINADIPNLDRYVVKSDLFRDLNSTIISKYIIPGINLSGYTTDQLVAQKDIPLKSTTPDPDPDPIFTVTYTGVNNGSYLLSTLNFLGAILNPPMVLLSPGVVEYSIPLYAITDSNGTMSLVGEGSTIYILKKEGAGISSNWIYIDYFTLVPGGSKTIVLT